MADFAPRPTTVRDIELVRSALVDDIVAIADRHALFGLPRTSVAVVPILEALPTAAYKKAIPFPTIEDVPSTTLQPASVAGIVFSAPASVRTRGTMSSPVATTGVNSPDVTEALLRALFPLLLPPPKRDATTHGGLDVPEPVYAFQGDGIAFLLRTAPGALLADDMGLGKTVQAIVALRHLIATAQVRSTLVVAPKAVVTSWQKHFVHWAPDLHVVAMTGDPQERAVQWRALHEARIDAGIITYDALRNDLEATASHVPPVDLLIADEVQRLKNPVTKTARAMRKLRATRRWGLTGTPLENDVAEIAAILSFLDRRATFNPLDENARIKHIGRMMLRRKRQEVLTDLPDLISNVVYVSLDAEQRQAYEKAEREGVARLRGQERKITNVLELITRLKQICNGVDGRSTKLGWVEEYVETATAESDKVIVVSQWVETLRMVEAGLQRHMPLLYTGELSQGQRDSTIEAFQTEDTHEVMLLSLRAGGVGLNLQAANHVVHFDSWWNPAVQDQATARAHRLGQAKDVFVSMLVTTDTIEERIQRILDDKRNLFDRVVDDFRVDGLERRLTAAELYGLFDLGEEASAIA